MKLLPSTLALTFVAATTSSACIRSPSEVDPPGEGTEITGQAQVKDLLANELVGGVDVTANALGTSAHAVTNENGFFRLRRLPLGTYDILLERRGSPPLARLISGVLLETDGQSLSLGSIQLGAPGTIEGRVQLRDEETFSAPGVLVVLVGTALRAFTDSEGTYRISGVPEGEYELVAVLPGFEPGQLSRLRATPNSRTLVEELTLIATPEIVETTVTGRATLQEGAEGVIDVVFFSGTTEVARAQTTDAGDFVLTVETGPYRVRFERAAYQPVELPGVIVLREGAIGLRPVVLMDAVDRDRDSDGTPDEFDPDRDNDGVPDEEDADPDDPTRRRDRDGDGTPDEVDDDIDGDGLSNDEELAPGDDGWVTDPTRADTDEDGVPDGADNCPTIENAEQADADGDGRGDACPDQAPCDLGPPRLFSVSPRSVRIGEDVLVVARPIASPACAPNGVQLAELVFAADGGATVTSMPAVASLRSVVADGVVAQEARYPVPMQARTGAVSLVLPYAAPSNGIYVTVEPPGLEVTDVVPFAADRGDVVTVIGQGFDAPAGGPIRLQFFGSAEQSVGVVEGDRFDVTVPADAAEGQGQVELRNDIASTSFSFTVSSTTPSISALEFEMVEPGADSLIVRGANLDAVTAVRFTGGVRVVPTQVARESLEIDVVPDDVRPGPIALEHAGPDIVSRDALSLIRRRRATGLLGSETTYSYDPVNGLRLLSFSGGLARFYRHADFTPLGNSTAVFGGTVIGLATRPQHDRGIVTVALNNGVRQTFVVRFSDLQVVGECSPPFVPVNNVRPDDYTFSDDGRAGYVVEPRLGRDQILLRVDMEPPTPAQACTPFVLMTPCGGTTVVASGGVAAFRDPAVWAFFDFGPLAEQGLAILQLDPSVPDISCVQAPVGNPTIGSSVLHMVWDEDNGAIWMRLGTGPVAVYDDDPSQADPTHVILNAPGSGILMKLLPGGRWMTNGYSVFDRRKRRMVWREQDSIANSVDVHPNGREFLRQERGPTYIFEIEAAP